MNRRHAAAIGLVGWYLMAPPMYEDTRKVDVMAPIGQWAIIDSFDSALPCREAAARLGSKAPTVEDHAMALRYRSTVCIATDDPRLAK